MACPAVASFVSIHNMCAAMIARHGSEALRARILPGAATMETILAYCLTEPGSGSDAAALRTRAERDGDGWRLTGTKAFISGGGFADLYVVMARTGGDGPKGISTFLVENGTPRALVRRSGAQDGLEGAADRAGAARRRAGAGGEPARASRARASPTRCRASTAAG